MGRSTDEGVNMDTLVDYNVIRGSAAELETLAIAAKASADTYREAVRSVAAKANLDASVLSAWVKARISDAPEKKAAQAEQLALLFEEFGE